jgi:hypothetical protein
MRKEKFSHLKGRQTDETPEIFYIKRDAYKRFFEFLKEKEAVVIARSFKSIEISLNEPLAIDAIRELLGLPPADKENATPARVSSVSFTFT